MQTLHMPGDAFCPFMDWKLININPQPICVSVKIICFNINAINYMVLAEHTGLPAPSPSLLVVHLNKRLHICTISICESTFHHNTFCGFFLGTLWKVWLMTLDIGLFCGPFVSFLDCWLS
jgi:hypothetical protein